LCARAFGIGTLMAHPKRSNLAACRTNGALRTASIDQAIAATGERIEADAATAIIVDGSYPTPAIEAVLSLASEAADTVGAVFLPPADAAMLAGLEAAGWTRGSMPGESNDAVLVIGDAFASHPPVARHVLDAKHAARGRQLLVVSPLAGGTAAFATRRAIVPPGGEAALLLDVARRLEADVPSVAGDGEADAREVEPIVEGLRGAKSPAIVLAQLDGTTPNGHIAACAAAAIAAKLDAPLLPLFTYGNALGAWQAASASGSTPLADIVQQTVEGTIQNLILVGVDPVAALAGLGEQMLDGIEWTAAAAPFANATTERADVVLPLGLWCEEDGEATLPTEGAVALSAVAPPAGGALTVSELVARLREAVPRDAGNRTQAPAQDTPSWQVIPPREGNGMTLVGRGDVFGFADGALTAFSPWSAAARPEPTVAIHPDDYKRAELAGARRATVTTPAGQMDIAVECTEDVPRGVAAVPVDLPQTRRLFRWDVEPRTAALACGPVEVTLGPAR
jgi:anaerobic selenocysteine-containing dehydrogenase